MRTAAGRETAILCSGFQGAFAIDDAYCAGRIVERLDAERTDAAIAAALIAAAYPDAHAGLNARTYGVPGLEAADGLLVGREGDMALGHSNASAFG